MSVENHYDQYSYELSEQELDAVAGGTTGCPVGPEPRPRFPGLPFPRPPFPGSPFPRPSSNTPDLSDLLRPSSFPPISRTRF